MRTVETSADELAKQLKLGKLAAVRNDPGRLAAGVRRRITARGVSGSLTIDNQKVTFDSPSRTVDELLAGVQRRRSSARTTPPPAPAPCCTTATPVTVTRVGAETSSNTRPIPFDTVQQDDPTLPIGADAGGCRTARTAP